MVHPKIWSLWTVAPEDMLDVLPAKVPICMRTIYIGKVAMEGCHWFVRAYRCTPKLYWVHVEVLTQPQRIAAKCRGQDNVGPSLLRCQEYGESSLVRLDSHCKAIKSVVDLEGASNLFMTMPPVNAGSKLPRGELIECLVKCVRLNLITDSTGVR